MLFPFLTSVPQPYIPPLTPGNVLWHDGADSSAASMTLSYVNLVATGSGTSGTTVITASADMTSKVQAGFKIRIAGTDIYTVASVSTTTINTVETLSTNYTAGSALALNRCSQWWDKSGLGNHSTQSTALARPVLNPAKQNGSSALGWDGASFMNMASGTYGIFAGDSTIFSVSQIVSETGSRQYVLGWDVSGTIEVLQRYSSTAGRIEAQFGTASGPAITGLTNTNMRIWDTRRAGATIGIQTNNGSENTNANGINVTPTRGNIGAILGGANTAITGTICEIAIWNRNLTAAEINQIYHYFSSKWAIAIPTNK